jgi:hypothetical protein
MYTHKTHTHTYIYLSEPSISCEKPASLSFSLFLFYKTASFTIDAKLDLLSTANWKDSTVITSLSSTSFVALLSVHFPPPPPPPSKPATASPIAAFTRYNQRASASSLSKLVLYQLRNSLCVFYYYYYYYYMYVYKIS